MGTSAITLHVILSPTVYRQFHSNKANSVSQGSKIKSVISKFFFKIRFIGTFLVSKKKKKDGAACKVYCKKIAAFFLGTIPGRSNGR